VEPRVEASVMAWMADDPDPADRAELRRLLDDGAMDELRDRFEGELHFGTAGLRGHLGAGPSRVNVATVRRVSGGLAAYLAAAVPEATESGVVIGHDARHGSERFADEAARVMSGAGLRVRRLPGQLPTPLVAFAVRHLGCAAGVMITASHNPPRDNGYKVFLGDGAQIAPPVDGEISRAISRLGPLRDVRLGDLGEPVSDDIIDDYLRAIIGALPAATAHEISIVYTPLHGVGRRVLLVAFAQAGFLPPLVVARQGEPDPDFPTLPNPNPEEPGALTMAITEARVAGADLVLANDPDADRLAVAIPDSAEATGWRVLRGDEVGALIGDRLLRATSDPRPALVASTIVSSSLLGRLAHAAGATYVETLTGFKWIMHDSAAHTDDRFLFGYEEAIGYAVNDIVRDKDGISAALVVAGIAAEAKREGQTIADRLDDIARRFGLYVTDQFFIELPGASGARRIGRIMAELRRSPPTELLGRPVTAVGDGVTGIPRAADGDEPGADLPRSDLLVWHAGERIRVVVRPSGTEPKLKFYLQLITPVAELGEIRAAQRASATAIGRLTGELHTLLGSREPVSV